MRRHLTCLDPQSETLSAHRRANRSTPLPRLGAYLGDWLGCGRRNPTSSRAGKLLNISPGKKTLAAPALRLKGSAVTFGTQQARESFWVAEPNLACRAAGYRGSRVKLVDASSSLLCFIHLIHPFLRVRITSNCVGTLFSSSSSSFRGSVDQIRSFHPTRRIAIKKASFEENRLFPLGPLVDRGTLRFHLFDSVQDTTPHSFLAQEQQQQR